MGGANVGERQRTFHPVAFQLPIHRGHAFEKAVIGVALLVVGRKSHADGGQARPLHLA